MASRFSFFCSLDTTILATSAKASCPCIWANRLAASPSGRYRLLMIRSGTKRCMISNACSAEAASSRLWMPSPASKLRMIFCCTAEGSTSRMPRLSRVIKWSSMVLLLVAEGGSLAQFHQKPSIPLLLTDAAALDGLCLGGHQPTGPESVCLPVGFYELAGCFCLALYCAAQRRPLCG